MATNAAVGVGTACVLILLPALSGCGSAAANTAAGLLGAGAVTGAATHSSAQVKVEVYDPRGTTQGEDFELDQVLAVRRTILETAGARLLEIEAAARPHVSQIEHQTAILRRMAVEDRADQGPAVRKGGLQLSQLADREALVHDSWERFQTAARRLAQSTQSAAQVRNAMQALRGFRAALSELATEPLGEEAFTEIRFLLLSDLDKATVTPNDVRSQATFDRRVNAVMAAGTDSSKGLSERLQEVFDAARGEFTDPAAAAVIAKDQRAFLDPVKAVETIEAEAETTISITLDAITTSVSLGPVSNEVTQIVLTPGKLLGRIADPANAGSWRSFSHCASNAGPGNNDVIFYMENQATPILKSATFDPTKFIVAGGAIFERAFSVLADAAGGSGAGTGAGTGTETKTGTGGGTSTSTKSKGTNKTGGGTTGSGGGASDTAGTANANANASTGGTEDPKAIKALQKQIKAVKAAEISALEHVLSDEASIKAVAGDPAKLKEAVAKAKEALGKDVKKLDALTKS